MRHALLISLALHFPILGTGDDRFRRGDSNGDSAVDIADPLATLFTLFVTGWAAPCLDAADANDDGKVDLSDVVSTLSYLFRAGPAPPPPGAGACPGPDPTPDGLSCLSGEPGPTDRPSAAWWPEAAPVAGARERRGVLLPATGGVFRVGEGTSFALVLEATSSPVSQAALVLASPSDPRSGNPAALQVVCDRDLGDPAAGGAPAGSNLAPFFLRDIDLWTDPIFLVVRAAMRIDGGSPLGPAPGRYRFQAQVVDAGCGASDPAAFDLEVLASREPEIHLWLEDDRSGLPSGAPRAASAATGGLTIAASEPVHLVLAGIPNARAAGDPALRVDPGSLQVFAEPAILPGTGPGVDLASRFTLENAGDGGARFRMRLDPAAGFPRRGNARLAARLSTAGGGFTGEALATLEVEVSYALDVQPIWTRECTGCHEKPELEVGLELVGPPPSRTHRNIVDVFAAEPAFESTAPLLIRPYYPERSYLVRKLLGSHLGSPVLGSGERMPRGGPPLGEADLKLIGDWVRQGAVGN